MSRLTRAPFYKPSLHDIPRPVHPLSPPDTEDSLSLHVHPVSREASSSDLSMSFITKVDPMDQYQTVPVDASTPKVFRRPSTMNYLHSGPTRETRSAPRPATRWLIIVVPPAAVLRNAQSSNLFLNSTNHSSSGILMPLLPSLSGQLTSIAREFAFPSTSGICIYLNINDSSLSKEFSLRVSDESWPILWANALGLDERQQQPPSAVGLGGLPIAGRVEFDLDLRKARWFESWVTACRRSSDSGISAPPSLRHHREESRTTVTHDQPEESIVPDDVSVTIQQKVPIIRHVPRKLSLLDRIETSSHRSSLSRPASRNAFISPPNEELLRHVTPALTPVNAGGEHEEEEEEPQTAIQRVERKVQNWRASSNFAASPLAATTGQTALEPANMPNTLILNSPSDAVDLAEEEEEGEHVLNLDDFTWSISSAGPSTGLIEPDSALLSDWRIPSVHLAERLEGSVCLTPSTATSWGAPDYDPLSPVMSIALRLPTPDIATRHIDDAPLTPETATSWGAPSEWPASPALSYRAPSIDLGARCLDSRPATPSTATSWGAPSEWPESPVTPFHVGTPDIGQRAFNENVLLPAPIVTTENWRHVWPYTQQSRDAKSCSGWNFVWPYFSAEESDAVTSQSFIRIDLGYPYINPYPAVYPNFDLYPAKSVAQGRIRSVDMTIKASYPGFSIYPAVYPAFEIYLGYVIEPQEISAKHTSVKVEANYPVIEIYAPVYPHFNIYPAKSVEFITAAERVLKSSTLSVAPRSIVVKLERSYPALDIYPAVYPDSLRDIYPTVEDELTSCSICIKLAAKYPRFNIYPAVYPHFDLYPSLAGSIVEISQTMHVVPSERVVYPHFNLYPPVRSGNISKPSRSIIRRQPSIIVHLAPSYPQVEIYPPVYPHLCIYPPVASPEPEKSVNVLCEVRYPKFDIYPAVYPFFDIYRSGIAFSLDDWREPKLVKLDSRYPAISTYSPIYPYFDIYNTGNPTKADMLLKETLICLPAAYPALDIYPFVYPYYDIYSTGTASDVTPLSTKLSTSLDAKYPAFDIYPAVYPNFQLYPSVQPVMDHRSPRKTRKTHQELHELVMSQWPIPVDCNGPSSKSPSDQSPRYRRPRRTHKELHELVFPSDSSRLSPNKSSLSASPSPKTSPNGYQTYPGLPVRPSEIRRTVSLNRGTRTPSERENVLSRNGSLRKLTPVEEDRIHSGRSSHTRDRSESHSDVYTLRRKPRRDSIVLERARHFGASAFSAEPATTSNQLTVDEPVDSPMPPPPPLPNKLPADLNRPVAKLDRSKFPFH